MQRRLKLGRRYSTRLLARRLWNTARRCIAEVSVIACANHPRLAANSGRCWLKVFNLRTTTHTTEQASEPSRSCGVIRARACTTCTVDDDRAVAAAVEGGDATADNITSARL